MTRGFRHAPTHYPNDGFPTPFTSLTSSNNDYRQSIA